MLTHVRSENLHDLWAFRLRDLRDALERVDPAQSHVEGRAAELIDRSGEALGHLPGFIERVTFGGAPSREGEIASGVNRPEHTEAAGENRQRCRRDSPSLV